VPVVLDFAIAMVVAREGLRLVGWRVHWGLLRELLERGEAPMPDTIVLGLSALTAAAAGGLVLARLAGARTRSLAAAALAVLAMALVHAFLLLTWPMGPIGIHFGGGASTAAVYTAALAALIERALLLEAVPKPKEL
jgi:hypothetical protein